MFILVTLVFFLMRIVGDPISAAVGDRLTPEQLQERLATAGFDRPIIVQYLEYLGQIATGNFGRSLTDNRLISEVLLQYGSATLELVIYSLIVAFVIGIPLGLVAAYFKDRTPDAVLRILAILAYATPVFFAGLLLKLVFSVWLGILPLSGRADTRVGSRSAGWTTRPASTSSTRSASAAPRPSATCSSTRCSRRSRSASSPRASSCGSCAPT